MENNPFMFETTNQLSFELEVLNGFEHGTSPNIPGELDPWKFSSRKMRQAKRE